MASSSGRSVWLWIGGGCLVVVIVGALAIGGAAWWGVGKVKEIVDTQSDPSTRTAKANEILGTQALPDGYHAMFALDLLGAVKLVGLTDRAPDAAGQTDGFDRDGFIYVEALGGSSRAQQAREFFEGKTGQPGLLREQGIELDLEEQLSRGSIQAAGAEVMYVVRRGRIDWRDGPQPALMSLLLIDCPEDDRSRFGMWFTKDPAPETAADQLDLTGTPGDEGALAGFLGEFSLCR